MNPWLVILSSILIVAAVLLLFSLAFTWLILKVSDRHVQKTADSYTKKAVALMPGTNCGKCGYESCFECAQAMIRGQESPSACAEGDDSLTEALFAAVVGFEENIKQAEGVPQPVRRSLFSRVFTKQDD